MSDTATAKVEGSTILTEPIKEATAPEVKLFPNAAEKAAQDTQAQADKAAADKAVADKAVADKAAADAASKADTTQEKTSEETKSPTETEKSGATTTQAKSQTDYDLVLPQDSPLSAEDLAATVKEAKEAGLPKEKAEALLQAKDQTAKAAQTRLKQEQEKAFEQTKAAWKETVAKDPEMGGDKLPETIALSSRAFKTLASTEFQIWAEKTGLGNYPEFVRLMAKVGQIIGEDRLIPGTVSTPPVKKDAAEILYGKTTPK